MTIPFTKLHGAENDFLLTFASEAPAENLPEIARQICARTTGIGADGWMLVWPDSTGKHPGVRTRLFNSDGSEPEISGNGTRCAAAFALLRDLASPPLISVITAAGQKTLRLMERRNSHFIFEMDMGAHQLRDLHAPLNLLGHSHDVTLLNVGNPQCAFFVHDFPSDWRAIAAAAESHHSFPNRTNVSFVRVRDRNTIEALFYERGAGETRSSGTGSTGAAVSAILRGLVDSPVTVVTPAGPLTLRWDESIYLTGPTELVAEGRYYYGDGNHR